MTKRLDSIDEEIVRRLRADGRLPVVALADAIGLSRSATQERLARLERDGTIAGYTIKLGSDPGASQAWLIVRLAPGRACSTLVPTLLAMAEVRTCHSVAGEIDLIVRVEVESAEALLRLRDRVVVIEGVAAVVTAPVLRIHAE